MEADAFQIPEVIDELTYVLTLTPNLNFHDREPLNGRAVTVEDALQTEARFKELSANALSWGNVVSSLEAIDETTMRMNLNTPYAPLFNLLGSSEHMKMIPHEIVDDGTVAERPVGSGPWMFDTFEPDVELTWTANPDWHVEGFPLVDGLVSSLIADPSTILANLEGGTFDFSLSDFTVTGPPSNRSQSSSTPSMATRSSAGSTTTSRLSRSVTLASGRRSCRPRTATA